jgi:CheY-like chemotaxis protein
MTESILKILIVDDHEENLIALEHLLDGVGAELLRASSGQEALALMLEHDFCLILLDVQMPEMDGFEVASLARRKARTRHVPIIFLTAMGIGPESIFKGYESGAVDYLVKPINPFVLCSKVRVFCELYDQRLTIEQQLAEIQSKNDLMQKQLSEIRTLRGLLPICSGCKRVRNDEGYWEEIENYVRQYSDAEFSHGLCPPCARRLYPELAAEGVFDVLGSSGLMDPGAEKEENP